MPRHISGHRTPRILLRLVRATQTFCSALVLVAGAFSVAKFGIDAEHILMRQQALETLGQPVEDGYGMRADWRAVLLVVVSSISIIVYPILAALKRRRISVAVEALLLSLWSSFMSLYAPTILDRFTTNCAHPKRRPATPIHSVEIDEDLKRYCMISQVGVAAGIIVIVFTFFSILLLLLLSYQSTELLIEQRAAELIQHHSFPTHPEYNYPSFGFSFPYTRTGVDERLFVNTRNSTPLPPSRQGRTMSRSGSSEEGGGDKGKAPMYRRDIDVSMAKEGVTGGLLSSGERSWVTEEGNRYDREKRAMEEEEVVQQLRQSHTRRVMNGGPLVPPIIRSPR